MAEEHAIGVIPGDGTGPEVIAEGLKVLHSAAQAFGLQLRFQNYDLGGERYLRSGELLPDSILSELKTMDAIYLGAIGHPNVPPGVLEREILLRMRFELDLYINLRPVVLYPGVETPLRDKGPDEIDFAVVRENTEGLYVGAGGVLQKNSPHEVAVQESINTRRGVERCVRFAFDHCRERGKRNKLTLCGKTNVLNYASDLWERTFREIAGEYPGVTADYAHVDAICMWMIKNPEWFDVIVTDNMFGDIITDLGAMIQGGLGIAAGANLNPDGVSMFEPMGGSAPKYLGLGVINPMAAISAGQMMLERLGEKDAANGILTAMKAVLTGHLKSVEAGRMGHTTSEVGDLVVRYVIEGSG